MSHRCIACRRHTHVLGRTSPMHATCTRHAHLDVRHLYTPHALGDLDVRHLYTPHYTRHTWQHVSHARCMQEACTHGCKSRMHATCTRQAHLAVRLPCTVMHEACTPGSTSHIHATCRRHSHLAIRLPCTLHEWDMHTSLLSPMHATCTPGCTSPMHATCMRRHARVMHGTCTRIHTWVYTSPMHEPISLLMTK